MTVAAIRLEDAALTSAVLPTTTIQAGPFAVRSPLRRAGVVVGDMLGAVGIILCVPFVILAIGIPIALVLRLLLWAVGLL